MKTSEHDFDEKNIKLDVIRVFFDTKIVFSIKVEKKLET